MSSVCRYTRWLIPVPLSSRQRPRTYYSTYDEETEVASSVPARKKILVLGSGPIRIGQGIEFDYCSVHCCLGAAEAGLRDRHHQQQPGDRFHRL